MIEPAVRTPAEHAQTKRLEQFYRQTQLPVMRAIEREVCGCAYGGCSWTTEAEARLMLELLELDAGVGLLDLGAGAGWPGLYLARLSGCALTLADLPVAGLQIARARAVQERISPRVHTAVADASLLPFNRASFDAISHCDLLCCLVPKREVLRAARYVIRGKGRMVFTVISVVPGLSASDRARAVANGPEFIEAEDDYAVLLGETGWTVVDRRDVTDDYAHSCGRQFEADTANHQALAAAIGEDTYQERIAAWQTKRAAIEDGLLRRDLFVATPA